MSYQYKDPTCEGFKRIKVSKNNHNKVFKYNNRTFIRDLLTTVEYYEKDDCIKVQIVPSLLGKLLLIVISPIHILIHGLVNKDAYRDILRGLFPKKYGAFLSHVFWDETQIKILKGE